MSLNLGGILHVGASSCTLVDSFFEAGVSFHHIITAKGKLVAITWVVVPMTEFRNLDVDTGFVSTVAENSFRQIQIVVVK